MEITHEKIILYRCPHLNDQTQCNNYKKIKTKPTRYISKSTRYIVLDRQKWICNNCGKHLKYSENHSYGDVVAHIDHIHPFSQWESYDGDINESSNLEALCPECNMRKHAKNGF